MSAPVVVDRYNRVSVCDWKWVHTLTCCCRYYFNRNIIHCQNLDAMAIYLSNTKYLSFFTYTYIHMCNAYTYTCVCVCAHPFKFIFFRLFQFLILKTFVGLRSFRTHWHTQYDRVYILSILYRKFAEKYPGKQFIVEATTQNNKKNKNKGRDEINV